MLNTIMDNEIKNLIEDEEINTVNFKSSKILSGIHKLAELMMIFGNNKFVSEDFCGRTIIGICDENHQIESFKTKPGYEEPIRDVAQNEIYPTMKPFFEEVKIDEKVIYGITIPKMINTSY